MILFLIAIAAIVTGLIGLIIIEKNYSIDNEGALYGSVYSLVGGAVFLVLLIIFSAFNHAFPEIKIANNNIKYEALIERKTLDSEYESYTKSDTIRDIAEWNKYVNTEKMLLDSPWTNALVSKKVIDELKYIE